ncbi:trypsin-like serine protease [Pseudomonas sp. Irchel s3f10]|uniref:trypsin-like serine protease n=1 Tax=Pseudomonas sp. Irchel s3f10 TaxID=2009137 RepID=UPI000BA2CC13|nr:trypsin-like serine protease [Pseudomonas sp. Irchel s3f10]
MNTFGFKGWQAIAGTIVMIVAAESAQSETDRTSSHPALEFQLATEVLGSDQIQLTNGILVLPGEWPALIMARFSQQTTMGLRYFSCTASLIGPNVVLTAAHCVDPQSKDGKALQASLKIGNKILPMHCDMHPGYMSKPLLGLSPRSSDDFALCILDDGGERPQQLKDMKFEVVDSEATLVRGSAVVMTGYGCKELKVVNGVPSAGKADNLLRIGDGVIDKPAGSEKTRPSYVTIRSIPKIEPALCPGDSGGPLLSGITAQNQDQNRRIRGVNSSIAVEGDYFVSRISATGTPSFRTWAKEWLAQKGSFKPEACGLNLSAGERQCRF